MKFIGVLLAVMGTALVASFVAIHPGSEQTVAACILCAAAGYFLGAGDDL